MRLLLAAAALTLAAPAGDSFDVTGPQGTATIRTK